MGLQSHTEKGFDEKQSYARRGLESADKTSFWRIAPAIPLGLPPVPTDPQLILPQSRRLKYAT